MKKLLIAISFLVVLFVVGIAVMAIMIDPIVRRGVEYGSTSTLKVPTHLGAASGAAEQPEHRLAPRLGQRRFEAIASEQGGTARVRECAHRKLTQIELPIDPGSA